MDEALSSVRTSDRATENMGYWLFYINRAALLDDITPDIRKTHCATLVLGL